MARTPRTTRRDALRWLAGTVGAGAAGAAGVGGLAGTALAGPSGGASATWTTGEQYGVGTVADHDSDDPSRVWFTLTEGALAGARFPRVDLMNLRTLDVVVADPEDGYAERTHRVDRTAESTLERRTEPSCDDALVFTQTVTETAEGRDWTVELEHVADPGRDAILVDVSFAARDGRAYDVYVLADLALSNSGRSDAATVREVGKDRRVRGGYAVTAADGTGNDDAAVFLDEDGEPYDNAVGVASRRGFDWATVDVVGGDSLSPLVTAGDASTRYDEASGNVAAVGRLGSGVRRVDDTVALGFAEGGDEAGALDTARASLQRGFAAKRAGYARSWREYLRSLDVPDAVREDPALRAQFDAAAMAVKAADSKQFPGAGLASLSVPWGVAVNADEPSDYGYNFTWARDLYHAFTAMEASGDVESALDATEYVYAYQQDDTGFIPQNTYVDGRTRWGGEQMDNISFPQVMAYQLKERHDVGFDEAGYGYENVRRSAEYVAQHGPATGQERWEEEAGLSPSTTAAEIAGLACAARLAADEGERSDALVWLALADHWQRHTADWMATDEGTDRHAETPYYFRINDDRDPDDGAQRGLANGGPTLDERNVVDAGFLELVRLGVTPADDPVVENSLAVVDDTIRVDTPNGPAWYRYNGDGYGEQGQNPDDAFPAGAPWALDNAGRGRLWPIFTGERGEYELLARGGEGTDGGGDGEGGEADEDALAPSNLLRSMAAFANSGRMIPEQVWDRPEPTEFGWRFGEGTGSATPLSWSMAGFVRLAHSLDAGEPVETPRFVRERYVEDGGAPTGPALDVAFPPTLVGLTTVTVSGETDAATVLVRTAEETVEPAVTDGSFSTEVAVPADESRITVVAATGDAEDGDLDLNDVGTTVRRSTVAYVETGDPVAELTDPTGDDHGPGSYTYPMAGAFVSGAFDLTSFGVYETADRYQFLLGLGDLTNPWGGDELSLQSLQVYVRAPDLAGGTTEARTGVNATFAAPYQRRVFVEGFTQPRVEAADGSTVTEDVLVTGYQSVDAVLVEVPKAALGDLPNAELVPLVLGQDGYSEGRVRPVMAENGGYVFGGGRDDDANPNVLDLLTPDGVSQADALGYTATEQATIPYVPL